MKIKWEKEGGILLFVSLSWYWNYVTEIENDPKKFIRDLML